MRVLPRVRGEQLLRQAHRRPPLAEQAAEGARAPGPFATFNRQTDVAWDAAGNIFVSDGYNNKRVVKFDKDGNFLKACGSRGKGPGQFEDVHTIQVDHQGNVYVGDRSNRRIRCSITMGRSRPAT